MESRITIENNTVNADFFLTENAGENWPISPITNAGYHRRVHGTPKVQRRFQTDPSIGKNHLVCLLRVRDEATYRVMLLR